ncbi:cyclin-dependent kinase-like 5 [Enoplosus armatus]|uniref:cyclin-dependent kinase-like 5 n=1 Tax=Enoplosus armatus TaxID=215367 RepID=UPI003991342E
MERYESLGLVGEGSYGTVLKCRHRDSGRLVAIKKFVDSDDDKTVKKIALREIKLLRQLRHDNLVNLLEVWKRRRRWYLVFEFVERTLLNDLEQNPSGLDLNTSRQHLYQILRAAAFCHQQNIIHRDIKPENILISQRGVVKLCDFGFARIMASPAEGGVYTDYVATRWYRAPELLVGDTKYSKPVDVWAVGCLLIEMLTGQPLFPGDSDLDQIYHIVRCFGNLTAHHQELFYRNPVFSGVRLPEYSGRVRLEQRFPAITPTALDLAQRCLQMDPERRAQCSELLEHPLFTQDSFHIRLLDELNAKIQKDHRENSTLPKIAKTPRREKDEGDEKNRRSKDKKQAEEVDEKANKEKAKKGEEKTEKTKGKQPSKPSKTIRNTSEALTSTKQSKALGAKIIDNAAKTTVAMKSKLGKATGAELRKEPEIPKSTKTLTSDSLEASKTAADLRDNYTVLAKPKHGKAASPAPKEDHLKDTDTKDGDPAGFHSSCSDSIESSVTEKSVMGIRRSPASEQSQDLDKSWNNSNTKVPKLSKSSTADHSNSSPKASLKSTTGRTDTHLTLTIGKISTTEYLEGASTAVTSEISNGDQVETKMTINNTSLSTSPPKTSDLSTQSSTVFIEASPADSTTALPKGTSNSKLSKASLDTKPTNDNACVPNKPLRGLFTDRELTEVSIATKNQQVSSNTSDKDISEDHGCFKMSPATKTTINHIEISDASGGDYKENPESSEIPKTIISVGTTIPKTLKVSGKENREDLVLSVSISATTKSSVTQISKVSRNSNIEQKNSREAELNLKSLKPPHSKPLIAEPKTKLGSFSKSTATMTLKTQKTTFSTEARKKRDNPERNDTTNISTVADSTSVTATATLDQRATTRSSVFHNMDTSDVHEFDFSVPRSSPPPPPPPPSSTPLLPSFSVISTNSPAASDHLNPGAGFNPGTHSLRCVDKPRHHGGLYSRQVSCHITGPPTAQASEKSLICERPFLSDRCNHGNSGVIAVAKKKSDVHFPDLRGSVLPELRGREGKHNKGTSKDQRKDKQPGPPSEPRQHGHNSPDTQTP